MAAICPACKSTNVNNGLDQAVCVECGAHLNYADNGTFKVDKDTEAKGQLDPADSSCATPTATPVYQEQAITRQPVVDTNTEPVPTPNKPGPTRIPAPDVEAQGVAGELSDETEHEKKHGGPDDQPRTADLTVKGEPAKDTFVTHSTDDDLTPGNDDLRADTSDDSEPKPKKAAKKAAAR